MSAKKIRNTVFGEYSKKILLLGIGMLCFLLSVIYQSRAGYVRLAINNYFSLMLFFVIAILNAFNIYEYVHACSGGRKNFSFCDLIEFFAYTFFSCGFFNVVLFPLSGIGFMEIVVMLMYLLGSTFAQGMRTKKVRFTGASPARTLIFGFVLFILKLFVFYLVDENIYNQFAEGNNTLRYVVFGLSIFAALSIVRHVSKIGKANLEIEAIKSSGKKFDAKNFFLAGCKAVGSAVKKTVTFVLSIFSGWVGIVILVVAGLLIFGIGIFAFDKFFNDIMKVVEPLLKKLLSTGEYLVNPGMLYTAAQFSALMIFTGFVFWLNKSCETNIENRCEEILENYVLNGKDFSSCDRLDLKERAVKEICGEKNELKKIALVSDRDEMEKFVKALPAPQKSEK